MRICRSAFIALMTLLPFAHAVAADLEDPGSCTVSDDERQRLSCVCVSDTYETPAAYLDQIKGRVLASSGGADFTPIHQPTPLDIGDGVMTKSQSSAELTVGMNCKREIGANASLVIRQTENGCACAALLADHPKPPLLHAALVVGGGILIVKHLPVSP